MIVCGDMWEAQFHSHILDSTLILDYWRSFRPYPLFSHSFVTSLAPSVGDHPILFVGEVSLEVIIQEIGWLPIRDAHANIRFYHLVKSCSIGVVRLHCDHHCWPAKFGYVWIYHDLSLSILDTVHTCRVENPRCFQQVAFAESCRNCHEAQQRPTHPGPPRCSGLSFTKWTSS